MISRIHSYFSVSCLILLAACGPKQAPQTTQMAANRTMAVVVRSISPENPEAKEYYRGLLTTAIQETYRPRLKEIHLVDESFLQNPENLYRIANAEVDDLFVYDINLPSSDWMPTERPENREVADQMQNGFSSRSVEIKGSVVNGANLRTVTLLQMNVPWNFKDEFEESFIAEAKKANTGVYANPNIYPRSDPLHFANLLYTYSNNQETSSPEALNCENAEEILGFYDKAFQLYQKAKSRLQQDGVRENQESLHELSTRMEQSKTKSNVLAQCTEDKTLGFSFEVDYGNIDQSFKPFIEQALQTVKMEDLLKKYTDKPVRLKFQLSEDGKIELTTFMRYDSKRYLAWTNNRIPRVLGAYHVVSFDPYFALMQTLVLLKNSVPEAAPQPLKSAFRNLDMSLILNTLLNGQISLRVSGNYNAAEKRVALAYPKSVFLSAPGFESKTILSASDEIFQEKGWMTLSSCKTLDGTMTEDGLLMRFLGLECKV